MSSPKTDFLFFVNLHQFIIFSNVIISIEIQENDFSNSDLKKGKMFFERESQWGVQICM